MEVKTQTNQNLTQAKINKADEFYTQYVDIEKEIALYDKEQFNGKVVFCNADDSRKSNFYLYFKNNFETLGLKRLITLGYNADSNGSGYLTVYDNNGERSSFIDSSGSFDESFSIECLRDSDIVVTNPPFSLFGKFMKQLITYKKKFILLGNLNSLSHIGIFEHFIKKNIWLGGSIHSGDRAFNVPDNYDFTGTACYFDKEGNKIIRVKGVRWFTNMDCDKSKTTKTILTKTVDELKESGSFQKYDHYDAYNVNSMKEIPYDLPEDVIIGCPITAIDKVLNDGYCHFEDKFGNDVKFEIIGQLNSGNKDNYDFAKPVIDGKMKYKRLLIKSVK